MAFSGSYDPQDVVFLLKPVHLAPTELTEKERLIQSGTRHYSEMISPEKPPDDHYLSLFRRALTDNGTRLAGDIAVMARALASRPGDEIVLVSLARAGTPIGVLLKRALTLLKRPCVHYSASIIRDRGIDEVALDFVLQRHQAANVVFVDGWTGKGAIAHQLDHSIRQYNYRRDTCFDPSLHVVADLGGVAGRAATTDDYLIPCAILNAVVSGLISRTILNSEVIHAGDFHGCIFYEKYAPFDVSRSFVDNVGRQLPAALREAATSARRCWDHARLRPLRDSTEAFVQRTMKRYDVADRNRIKPGIGESTRALLRRVPERLLLRDFEHDDIQHLLLLAKRSGVPVDRAADLPFRAAAVIRSLGTD